MKTYNPHPKQEIFHKCAANEILYGGAAGPGKSHALRHEGLTWCMRIPGLHVYLFRRTFPDLEKNHIIPSLEEFPRDVGKYRDQKKRWEFKNGSMLHFCHAQYEKDVFHYQGAEIHILLIDELTSFTDFMYDYLRGRTRCTLNIPEKYKHKVPGVYCGSNPGGIGHEFVKMRWVDPDPDKEMKLLRAPKNEGGMLRCYIPGLLKDNPSLTENDPGYEDRLDGLPEPYRTAYKEGDWDIFMGQAFNFGARHIIKPIPIPEFSPLYMTFDWGFGAPFSVGFWWVDADNRLYRFSEWYGWNGTPGKGLRLTDEQIAEGINQRKKQLHIEGKEIIEICDPTCFNKKPDYKGGGQGPSTAEIFKNGKDSKGKKYGIKFKPGDPSRDLKLRQFHSRLRIPEEENELPMLVVYDTCEQFRRTIPLLQTDPLNVEDIDTTMEDHIYDESCHFCMARPIGVDDDKVKKIIAERQHKAKLAELDSSSRHFWENDFAQWKQGVLDQQEYERTGGLW